MVSVLPPNHINVSNKPTIMITPSNKVEPSGTVSANGLTTMHSSTHQVSLSDYITHKIL